MDDEMKLDLASMIKQEIEEEFKTTHLTGNLMNTVKIEETESGYDVVIPADMYDLQLYISEKKLVFTNNGSYASLVDKKGGLSGKHKGYVEKCIYRAIEKWMAKNQIEGKVE